MASSSQCRPISPLSPIARIALAMRPFGSTRVHFPLGLPDRSGCVWAFQPAATRTRDAC